ncbi:MAG TPA: hypothetical protein VNG90_00355 [Candidatus Acidoferrum sp.]|nr:hypothetical protein [Candidatus Acidoferrum sp.]
MKNSNKNKKPLALLGVGLITITALTTVTYLAGNGYVHVPAVTSVVKTTQATQVGASTPSLTYYGADLSKMSAATGVNLNNPTATPSGKPWPQNAGNYCFIASTQAVVNYDSLLHGANILFPSKNSQGPSSGNPNNESSGQNLYDLDHYAIPAGGPLKTVGSGTSRRPFTLANIAYDFGGDPRSISAGVDYEITKAGYGDALYHQHIYHTSATVATFDMAKSLAQNAKPIIAIVNHAEHAVVVAGVWATANPLTNSGAQISSVVIFNPWNQSWGTYLSRGYYAKVSYNDWVYATSLPSPFSGINSWFDVPYQTNNNIDPDPAMGIYQAGTGTLNPNAHHWINNLVTIQYDGHATSADTAYDENDAAMTAP